MMRLFLTIVTSFGCFIAIGQTKKETVEWLNNKFGSNRTLIKESVYSSYSSLVVKEDGSFKSAGKRFWEVSGEEQIILTGNVKNLSTIVTSKTFGNITYFYVTCRNGECITQSSDGKPSTLSYVAIGYLNTYTDKTLIPRTIKALTHFIMLCGGKRETF